MRVENDTELTKQVFVEEAVLVARIAHVHQLAIRRVASAKLANDVSDELRMLAG